MIDIDWLDMMLQFLDYFPSSKKPDPPLYESTLWHTYYLKDFKYTLGIERYSFCVLFTTQNVTLCITNLQGNIDYGQNN